jgi:Lrp/AsnC family leucine-responsive transcriptional regulator
MENLDLKDRKILYQLDLNCRQSNAQLGRKVGLSKQVVDYRIKRMEDEGIINGYWTAINSFKLGFDVYRYYISYQNASQKIKDEIIDFLVKYENTWSVYSATGLFDLGIVIWIKDLQKFTNFWEEFNDIYGDYLSEKIYSVFLNSHSYRHGYLTPDLFDQKEYKQYIRIGPASIVEIDKIDYKLLNLIVLDARKPLIDIAGQLKISSQTIRYRIKNLMNRGIIQSFRVRIDYSKLNLQQFFLGIWFRKLSKRREIWKYLENNPNIIQIVTCAGYADLQAEIIIDNVNKIENLMNAISEKFPDTIRNYNYSICKRHYILRCLPIMKF